MEEQKENFERYAEIKKEIKELTSEVKDLEPILTDFMVKNGADKVQTEFGGFTLKEYTSIELTDEQKNGIKILERTIEELSDVVILRGRIKDIEAKGKVVTKKGILFR